MINIGQAAPAFEAQNEKGETISHSSLLGSKYILLFYGQDDTPTCTKQVCAANSTYDAAKAAGFQVFGISPDTVKRHQKFIDKYKLSISLLSVPDKKMMYDYTAYGPKIFMGKEVIGVYRKCFFVDEKGNILAKIEDVNAAKQGEQINEVLASL